VDLWGDDVVSESVEGACGECADVRLLLKVAGPRRGEMVIRTKC
jgi:hypothetical protein